VWRELDTAQARDEQSMDWTRWTEVHPAWSLCSLPRAERGRSAARRVPPAAGATHPLRRSPGFSIIELMVVVALAGVLLGLAVPSFRGLIERNRAAGEMNSLVGDLQFARSEAIKRGLPVSVCPSSDSSTCLGAGTWHSGWIVFTDPDRSGTLDDADAEEVLRIRAAWSGGDTLVADPDLLAVTYGREGFATNLPAGVVMLPLRSPSAGEGPLQCLVLNRVGRQTVQRGGTGACS
jgi:type IV fimbrial biogenesis protein FimT